MPASNRAAPLRLKVTGITTSALVALGLVACTQTDPAGDLPNPPTTVTPPGTPDPPGPSNLEPGAPVRPQLPTSGQTEREQLLQQIDAASALSLDEFQALHAQPATFQPTFQPTQAAGLDLIQDSSLALEADELEALQDYGFVISDRQRFPTFTYGLETIYMEDLPIYVSADAVLEAIHRSYDDILKAIELASLSPTLDRLLEGMRSGLDSGAIAELGAQAEADADVYLAVALSLLRGETVASLTGGDATLIDDLVAGATTASGWQQLELFGVLRDVDFSQFTPRGHYTDAIELERYFRSMIWLGRIDFRLLETQDDGSQLFHRRQLEAMLALHGLVDGEAQADWQTLHDTIGLFVGEPDFMTLPEVDALLADLGITRYAELVAVPDETIAQAILDGGYGTQRISSHIVINGIGAATLPLSSSFALLGQRYVVDSHVFSNVVYDRVNGGDTLRMMPNPLDVAYAALANDQAAALLESELRTYEYQGDLRSMRLLVDAHEEAFWQQNLYNLWLHALRALSPRPEALSDPAAAGLPSLTASEAWGRRMLNTQLASWAELRHDTILYAKQSYSSGTTCEFPDAYVDPYPDFFAAVATYAERGLAVAEQLDYGQHVWLSEQVPGYFHHLYEVAGTLEQMARQQQTGDPFTEEQMAFINDAVVIQWGCGSADSSEGWYGRLFFDNSSSVAFDPTIADVHTQPTDEGGFPVGRVLHVATGLPRLMVVTVETCTGPRAYAGLVSAYFEVITEDFDRLDDDRWSASLRGDNPADVPWMADIVMR